jgi:hypothetical protein
MDSRSLAIVGASRPHPAEVENGDAWVVHQHGDVYRLSVIDGLGHGPDAAAATEKALCRLETVGDVAPGEAIRACHDALAGMRGVVMSVVSIDGRAGRLRFAGVGNVEARLLQDGKEHRLVSYRGIVGVILPKIHTFEYSLSDQWLLLVHTDGINARFDLVAEAAETTISSEWAQRFLDCWARVTDDATVVAVTARRPGTG